MGYPLFEYAFVPLPFAVDALAGLAQPENWEYRFARSNNPKPILYNYLHYTFIRLQEEGKIITSGNGQTSCFNTGLITPNYEEIYALFEPNHRVEGPHWKLKRFCRESDKALLDFGKLPELAHYFDDPAELLLDTRLPFRKNVDHIIDDNKERFPAAFRSTSDNHQLRIALNGAIEQTLKRVHRNYKTAVPQYYQGNIQLLLPICMTNPARADLALVVYKEHGVYLASTCLTLDMAYNNARQLARPDTEWLEP